MLIKILILFSNISDKDLIEISSKNIVTVFQLSKKYLIAPYSEGVLFVHQRRAHERILYEQYILERESHSVSSQSLALPLVVSLDSFSISLIQSNTESLNEMGFKIYKAYHDTIEFDGIPDILKVEDIPYFLSEWLTHITNGTVNAFSQLDILARTLAKQYCIPMGKKLESHEQIELMNKLFSCKEPDRNPEGKVVYKLFSSDKINSFFSL
jgi:DNA mismatch repair protein MutL